MTPQEDQNSTYHISIEPAREEKLSEALRGYLNKLQPPESFSTQQSFNQFCRDLSDQFKPFAAALKFEADNFSSVMGKIESQKRAHPEVAPIPTSWGGVLVTAYEPPKIEKYLAVRAGGYLALEMHEKKEEALQVLEGLGLLLEGTSPLSNDLKLRLMTPGSTAEFRPGVKHCLIALSNLLVFEKSLDHKGMDKDLIFIFTPDQSL